MKYKDYYSFERDGNGIPNPKRVLGTNSKEGWAGSGVNLDAV
jgi:hypothetical protein